MTRTRLQRSSQRRGALTLQQWTKLANKALQAAQKAGDTRRVTAIQAAIKQGNPSKALRKLGIICEADIQREFGQRT